MLPTLINLALLFLTRWKQVRSPVVPKKKKKVVIVTETQVSICTEKGTAGLDTSC